MNEPSRLIVPPQRKEDAATSLIAVISRAATDPSVDIAKMERLLQMHSQIKALAAEEAFNTAMNAAQAEMGPISADAMNPQTKSKYASYAQLDKALRPIYTRHGFSISFNEGISTKPEHVMVLAYLSHNGGHTRPYQAEMPADGKGAKGGDVMTKTHAAGAAKSYGKRYILKDAFNVAVGEGDVDGNSKAYISEKQVTDLRALLTEVNASEDSFLRTIKAESLEKILAGAYSTVIAIIEAKRKHA